MIKLNVPIEELNKTNHNTLMENLGIEYLEAKEGYVKAKMPVNEKTMQPMGILHGGASVALAETIGGLGSVLLVDFERYNVVGANISANHVSAAKSGMVYGEAKIIHQGRNTHVWSIEVKDEEGKLISISRLTNMIIERK